MALESKKSKLEFESLSLKDFLNAFYKEYADFRPNNKQEFKEKIESYRQDYEANENQNEPAIVANALAPFFESLGFQTKFAHKHEGNSEIDLALLKDSNVEMLIEAKKPNNQAEMFSPNKPNYKALHAYTSTNDYVNLYELESLPIPKITNQTKKRE